MRRPRRTHIALTALAALSLLTACAGAPGPNNVATVAAGHIDGFWPGLWHGFILPVTFLVSLFNHDVGIYDVHNNGTWYNLGFVLGLFTSVGALSRGGRRPARRSRKETTS